jgi:hypothetical protein
MLLSSLLLLPIYLILISFLVVKNWGGHVKFPGLLHIMSHECFVPSKSARELCCSAFLHTFERGAIPLMLIRCQLWTHDVLVVLGQLLFYPMNTPYNPVSMISVNFSLNSWWRVDDRPVENPKRKVWWAQQQVFPQYETKVYRTSRRKNQLLKVDAR